MRVLMVAWGSRGDVAPYLALGRGLAAAGYDVDVAAARVFAPLVAEAGLGVRPFDIDLSDTGDDPVVARWLAGSDSVADEVRNMRAAMAHVAPVFADGLVAMVEQADAFVAGVLSLDPIAGHAARAGKPVVSGALSPGQPTTLGPALLYPARPSRDSRLNRLAGWWQLAGLHSMLRPALDAARQQLGLPRAGLREHARLLTATPTVLGASPLVVPLPADWPNTTITGYWVSEAPRDYQPPPGLAEFLAAGDPPVYLGFGSMPAQDADALRQLVLAALTPTRRRAVLGGSLHTGGEPVRQLADGVVSIAGAPHEWLFPQTAGVVIHGGAGTTAAALRAGVAVGVVSHMGDQHYWGRRVRELGAGPAPLHRKDLTVGSLTTMLDQLPQGRTKAAALGEKLRAEDGVARAVEVIREVFG